MKKNSNESLNTETILINSENGDYNNYSSINQTENNILCEDEDVKNIQSGIQMLALRSVIATSVLSSDKLEPLPMIDDIQIETGRFY